MIKLFVFIVVVVFNPYCLYEYASYGYFLSAFVSIFMLLGISACKTTFDKVIYFIIFLQFSIVPAFQLATNSTMYMDEIDPNSSSVVIWFFLVFSFLIPLVFYLNSKTSTWTNLSPCEFVLSINYFYLLFYLCIALFAYVYIYMSFGGVSGMVDAYNTRLETTVTDFNPLEGFGLYQALANVLPLLVFVFIQSKFKIRTNRGFLLLAIVVLGIAFLVSGIFGSRQGLLFVAWAIFWIWHRTVNQFSKSFIRQSVIFAVLIFIIITPFKFFGGDFSFDMLSEFNQIRHINVTFGPLGFMFLRDFGRFDVQTYVVDALINNTFDIQYGKTIIGGLSSAIPSFILPVKFWSPTDLKSQIFLGDFWMYLNKTTLLSGLPGEFIMNFGYMGFFFFSIIYGGLLSFSYKLNKICSKYPQFIYLEAFIIPLPILILLFDSNVISYYIFRWIVLFSIPMIFMVKSGLLSRDD